MMTVRSVGIASLLVIALMGTPTAAARARVPLKERPFTVVAVVDTGINPYHIDFRAPELDRHPSSYISGFPRDAKTLRLSLGAATYEQAVAKDRMKWATLERDELYWIPGTNIVGVIEPTGATAGGFPDENGHGTATASLAGGRVHGPESNDILIVAVPGFLEGLQWAARQPWIDVISNSYAWFSGQPPSDEPYAQASRTAVKAGKIVCFASANYAAPFWVSGTQGPSWHMNVGAASEETRGEHAYTGWPNDVLGPAGVSAANLSIDGEYENGVGTSVSAPIVCGQAARAISEVRRAMGDYSEGAGMGFASGRRMKGSYLKDGCLDRVELEDALQATAVPAEPSPPDPNDPDAIPAAPGAPFVRGGYGIVDQDSGDAAIDVLLGRTPRPERPLEDAWITHTDLMRAAVWGSSPKPIGCR